MVDLEKTDPRGNLAVLVYRGLEALAKGAEAKHGVAGIWDAVKPHVNGLVAQHVSNIDMPIAGQVLLEILRANYNREKL